MNILNKIKMIDTVIGTNDSTRTGSYINNYYKISETDDIIERIISKYNKVISFDELKFLEIQSEDMLEASRTLLTENSYWVSKYLAHKKTDNIIKFSTIEDFELFKFIICKPYYAYAKELVEIQNQGVSAKNIIILLDIAEKYDWSPLDYGNKLKLEYNDIADILNCNILFDLEEIEIVNVVRIIKDKFNIDYSQITEEQLDVLKSEWAWYIKELDKNQLGMIIEFGKVLDTLSLKSMSRLDLPYSFCEDTLEFLNAAKESVAEQDELTIIINSFLNAINYNIIYDINDIKLLTNKIKYGFKPMSNIDFCSGLTGISSELLIEYNLSYNVLSKLACIKKFASKGFYKTLINNKSILTSLHKISCRMLAKLANIIEMGQLNVEQIEEMFDLTYKSNTNVKIWHEIMGSSLDFKISFEEFKLIINNNSLISLNDMSALKDMKQTQRLLKIKERLSVMSILKDDNLNFSREGILDAIEGIDINKSMKKNNPFKIKEMSEYLVYLFMTAHMTIESREDFEKIKFMSGYWKFDNVKTMSMKEIEESIWNTDSINGLMRSLELSEDFKDSYRDNIMKFCMSDDFSLVTSYLKNRRTKDTQRQGTLLIAKAIMAGKYEELKFVHSDIEKEISLDISSESFDSWKETSSIQKNQYIVKDESDFKTIMTIGEVPVSSCMNYKNGMYSHCLLSNFDTSKKILTIYKKGTYVGRAIIRLTLMSDINASDIDIKRTDLTFLDVDRRDIVEENKINDSKKLIIFLEKCYTTLDSSDFKDVYPMIVELLKGKSEKMGAKLVVSRNYSNFVSDDCSEEHKYVFITASKNGTQYLDSFDGSTSDSYCYKSGKVYIY